MPRNAIGLFIPQLKHARAVQMVETALVKFPDITGFEADLKSMKVYLSHDSEASTVEDIVASLRELGMDARVCEDRRKGFWARFFS